MLDVTSDGPLVFWTLDHYLEGNALGRKMQAALQRAYDDLRASLESNKAIHGLVIRASAPPAGKDPLWVAGGNIHDLRDLQDYKEAEHYAQSFSQLFHAIAAMPIPVLMAIHGAVIGGGAEFALFGDIRIASAASYFEFRHAKLGMSCAFGSVARLSAMVGSGEAAKLLLLGGAISAEKAHEMGLVQVLCRDEEHFKQEVEAICEVLKKSHPAALRSQKMHLHYAQMHAGYDSSREAKSFANLWSAPSFQAFLHSFPARKS